MIEQFDGFFNVKKAKEKFKNLKNHIYDDVQDETFTDISNKWISFLESDKKGSMRKNSYILWCLGGRGSGKTSQVFKDTTILLKNPKRNVCFWKTPEELVNNIESVCPEELKGRYRTAYRLRDIKPNDIFIIDEGLIGANAKEALKKEMRNLIKFLSKSRHMNIIAYINSISMGILRQFRDAIDIVIYKRLPRMLINNNPNFDYVLSNYKKQLTNLKEKECIIISSYKRFENEGYMSLELYDHCPWFSDNISMYHKDVNPDSEFDEAERRKDQNVQLVEWLISNVRSKYHNVRDGYRNFRMWLYTNHTDVYIDNQSNLKTIYELYCHYIDEGYVKTDLGLLQNEVDQVNEIVDLINTASIIYDFSKIEEMAIKRSMKNSRFKDPERNYEIYRKRLNMDVKQLAAEYSLSVKSIRNLLNETRGKWDNSFKSYKKESVNYYKGHIFEEEYAKFLDGIDIFDDKVVVDGKRGSPDLIAEKDGIQYVFSLKNRNLEDPKSTFALTNRDIMPELNYCNNMDRHKCYLIVACLNNETNKTFCFHRHITETKEMDLKKLYKKHLVFI